MKLATSFGEKLAESYADHALSNVHREYPNKMGHVMLSERDIVTPRQVHPIFFGSFDWHSSVHSWWTLARILQLFPESDFSTRIVTAFEKAFTFENLDKEFAYLTAKGRSGFSRPYGRAWLVKLAAEVERVDALSKQVFSRPLLEASKRILDGLLDYHEKLTYPVRSGTHNNTSLPMILVLLVAKHRDDRDIISRCRDRLVSWHFQDSGCQAWEPSQDDFLSPSLSVAAAMSHVLDRDEFDVWLRQFLPHIDSLAPRNLFEPVIVTDRQDYSIVHLDGLNLSRAWCLRQIIGCLGPRDELTKRLTPVVSTHIRAALPHVLDSYAGSHWLMTYVTLALTPLD